jgi:hypothetical protein
LANSVPEWIYEEGLGETRAALMDQGRIVEALVEWESAHPKPGAVVSGRLRPHRIAELDDGGEAYLDPLQYPVTEGAKIKLLITREALPEPGKPKRMRARCVAPDTALCAGPSLLKRLEATGYPIRTLTLSNPDAFEDAGWSECLQQVESGLIPFDGGALVISMTPGMTVIDIDGTTPIETLAMHGVKAAACAIRLFGIAGNIAIDVPSLPDKAARIKAVEMFDAHLLPPFERTAINGFGLLQVIRPRQRASMMELAARDPVRFATHCILRQAQRGGHMGARTLVVHALVADIIHKTPAWIELLSKLWGGTTVLRADNTLAIGASYVE